MDKMFEESIISGIAMKNRIIRSATHEAMGDEAGSPTDELYRLYENLADGGVGCIITGLAGIHEEGKAFPRMLMMDKDDLVMGYRPLVDMVHGMNVPIIAQLAHGGGKISPASPNKVVVAPSKKKYPPWNVMARELEEKEILKIIDSFVLAIARSKEAGFDGVQLHGAHGFLLSEFLSPHCNNRTDKWGGTIENRFRIIAEIMKKARQEVGDYPIWIKISSHDGDKNGITISDTIEIAKMFQHNGGDVIEVSCGGTNFFDFMRVTKIPTEAILAYDPVYGGKKGIEKKLYSMVLPKVIHKEEPIHLYNVDSATKIKEEVSLPVIVVGGFRHRAEIERVLMDGSADYVSLSRPLIIEPGIVNQFRQGKKEKSACIDCGFCAVAISSAPLRCYHGKVMPLNQS